MHNMAQQAKSKAVSKDDLRRLMKASSTKPKDVKLDSPLAKYNSLRQLTCIVCGTQVKSERLWNPHLLGRSHKDNVEKLKLKQQKQREAAAVAATRTSLAPPTRGILKRKESEVPAAVLAKVARLSEDGASSVVPPPPQARASHTEYHTSKFASRRAKKIFLGVKT